VRKEKVKQKDEAAEELYAFLVSLFILMAVACSGITIFIIRLDRGIRNIMSSNPLNNSDLVSYIVLLMPSFSLMGLIFISFCKRAWIKNTAISVLIVQVCILPFNVMLIEKINNKRSTTILFTIWIGSCVLFWLLLPAIFELRKRCGHFQEALKSG